MNGKIKYSLYAILIVFIIFLLFNPLSDHEQINIAGSTSVQPVAESLAEDFSKKNPNFNINVQGGGSGMGIRAVKDGIADIGTSSKELSPEEKEGINVHVLGYEGIVIVVSNENSVDELNSQQIQDIFSGKIKNWKEVGGKDKPIHIITREDGSGTRDAFESLVMGDAEILPSAVVQSSTESVKQSVSTDSGAIGYVSLSHMSDDVKGLKVNGIDPTEEEISNGNYKLQRPFLFLYNDKNDDVIQFIKWLDSPEAKKILRDQKIVVKD